MTRFLRGALTPVLALLLLFALTVLSPVAALAQGFSGQVYSGVKGVYGGTNAVGQSNAAYDLNTTLRLQPGVGTGKADKVYTATRTLAASASEDLDLAGVLLDPFGATLTFAKVKAIYVTALAANTNTVMVGGASSNGFLGPLGGATFTVGVAPGGLFQAFNPVGWTVTPSTGDLLHVANGSSGSSVTYTIVVIGTSS